MSCAAAASTFIYCQKKIWEENKIVLYCRQKKVCGAAERMNGLSATGIHSTVGRRAFCVHIAIPDNAHASLRKQKHLSTHKFHPSQHEHWLIGLPCNIWQLRQKVQVNSTANTQLRVCFVRCFHVAHCVSVFSLFCFYPQYLKLTARKMTKKLTSVCVLLIHCIYL